MRRILAVLICFASAQLLAQASSPAVEHSIEVVLKTDTAEILINDEVLVSGGEHYQFRLAAWLNIESLLLDGQEVRPRVQGPEYWLALPDSNTHELQFTLRGAVPARDSQQGSRPGILSSGGVDGFFLPGYDAWIPRDESGRISYRTMVTVPAGQRAVETGKLVSEQANEDAYISTFETVNPGEPPSLLRRRLIGLVLGHVSSAVRAAKISKTPATSVGRRGGGADELRVTAMEIRPPPSPPRRSSAPAR